ncbi:cytochrome P450 [Nocardia goodfellowii]
MRQQFGPLVPVELAPNTPATLVIGYHTALRILRDPEHFPADPRHWEKTVAPDCPILPMLRWRPNALRSTGVEHTRYRQPTTAALNAIDMHALHAAVESLAVQQINTLAERRTADLIGDYAKPLSFTVLNSILGCPPAIGERVAVGIAAMFEAGDDAGTGAAQFEQALGDLVALKRDYPGADVTSRMLAHPATLTDTEMVHQLVIQYAAGIEPLTNLIINTLRLMLTDERFGGSLLAGSLSTRDALDEVLFTDPPLSNYCISYPRQPMLINDKVWLPAHQPVVISMAACNADPAINNGQYSANSSHLAFSAGIHACPANHVSYLIAKEAIDQILDAIPDMRLACAPHELHWRPGPFHRSLATLPVTFPKFSPLSLR